jgi:aminoglycoside 2''-phosphotransferase
VIDIYRQVIEKHFTQEKIFSLTPNNGGWSSYVLNVNGEYIFRFPRREEIREAQAKEIRLLPELSKSLSLPIPKFEYILQGSNLQNCAVGYRKIPGVPLSKALLVSPEIARQLGEFLTVLHRFPIEHTRQLGVPGNTIADWLKKYVVFYTWVKDNVFPLLTDSVCARWVQIWENFLDDPVNFTHPAVLIHGDLGLEHILCNPELKTVTGIIDWEDTCIGDQALDFVGLFCEGGQDFIEVVLQYYRNEVDENLFTRIQFYTRIVPFHEVQYGLLTGDDVHFQNGIKLLSGVHE